MRLIPARLFERVIARSERLFEDGYWADAKDSVNGQPVTFTVGNPDGATYEVSTLFETCSCPFFADWHTCKHLRGIGRLIEEQALDLQVRALDGGETEAGCDPYYELDPA